MRASSRIEALSPAQIAALPACRDRWMAVAMSTRTVNRRRVTRALAALYDLAGLGAPEVVFTRSPFEARQEHMKSAKEAGVPVSARLRSAAAGQTLDRLEPDVWHTLRRELSRPVRVAIDRTLARPVAHHMGEPAAQVYRSVIGAQYDADVAAFNDFARHELGLGRETEAAERLAELSRQAGFVIACRHVCFVADRPSRLRFDEVGRLHAADGPALSLRDGRRVYAWHGTRVPGDVILRPERLTAARIDAETNVEVRRCMVDRLGVEAYLAETEARLAHQDWTGRLWVKEFSGGDRMAVVEVENGSLEPDGTRRRYFLRVPPDCLTACQAVAWTYGLDEDEYQLIVRT